jgi:hypothetical protein
MTLGNLAKLLRQHWPFADARGAVLDGYRALGSTHRHVLADIALRNHVFHDTPAGDATALAIAEGRRRCALEIFQLATCSGGALYDLIEKKPEQHR